MRQHDKWTPKEFNNILYQGSEVLHSNPMHEIVNSNCGICQQRHHVIGILIFNEVRQAVINLKEQSSTNKDIITTCLKSKAMH